LKVLQTFGRIEGNDLGDYSIIYINIAISKLITVIRNLKKELYRNLVNESITFYFIAQINAAATKSGYIPRYCFTSTRRYRVYRKQRCAKMKKYRKPFSGI